MKSPCIKTCQIDHASQLCIGCFRTLDEIAGWSGFSDIKRQSVLDELDTRRSKLAVNTGTGR
ncbi:DUF1289 domain-containing protein [Labrenzia sp. PHM005]|uniref:DUF1289 domain-containing protein n=1 Tax=Labrenzia sp. PHM005 TaxID=2590016 RepID=UPI001FFDC053|nr:DUF1289 domain-containing protein [Labrenzia sp. PHM005]